MIYFVFNLLHFIATKSKTVVLFQVCLVSVSIAFIANITGLLMSGYLAELLGRKRTLFISSCIMLAGWILIYFAHDLSALLVSR